MQKASLLYGTALIFLLGSFSKKTPAWVGDWKFSGAQGKTVYTRLFENGKAAHLKKYQYRLTPDSLVYGGVFCKRIHGNNGKELTGMWIAIDKSGTIEVREFDQNGNYSIVQSTSAQPRYGKYTVQANHLNLIEEVATWNIKGSKLTVDSLSGKSAHYRLSVKQNKLLLKDSLGTREWERWKGEVPPEL